MQGKQSLDGQMGQGRLSGNIVVSELIRNMELGQFEMAYAVLLPCVFTVYLNPADCVMLSGVLDFVVEDARKALRTRVAELNGKSSFTAQRRDGASREHRRKGTPKEHKIACREWDIEFLPDPEVPRGDVEIHSELNETPTPEFRGTKTTLVGREPSVTQRTSERRLSHPVGDPVYAEIHYKDDSGARTYQVTRNRVRVGRGGDEQPVEVALHTTDEISREHVIIRRDAATGAFSIMDASTNGTWVNGKRLRKGVEDLLPARAKIGLGEVIDLTFEVRL